MKSKTKKTASPMKVKVAKKSTNGQKKTEVKISAGLPADKQGIIESFAQNKGDTGSPEVQVALLSFKIEKLTHHLDENKKDNHSRRGLLKVIAKRRRILNYLQKIDEKRYRGLIDRLGLKK